MKSLARPFSPFFARLSIFLACVLIVLQLQAPAGSCSFLRKLAPSGSSEGNRRVIESNLLQANEQPIPKQSKFELKNQVGRLEFTLVRNPNYNIPNNLGAQLSGQEGFSPIEQRSNSEFNLWGKIVNFGKTDDSSNRSLRLPGEYVRPLEAVPLNQAPPAPGPHTQAIWRPELRPVVQPHRPQPKGRSSRQSSRRLTELPELISTQREVPRSHAKTAPSQLLPMIAHPTSARSSGALNIQPTARITNSQEQSAFKRLKKTGDYQKQLSSRDGKVRSRGIPLPEISLGSQSDDQSSEATPSISRNYEQPRDSAISSSSTESIRNDRNLGQTSDLLTRGKGLAQTKDSIQRKLSDIYRVRSTDDQQEIIARYIKLCGPLIARAKLHSSKSYRLKPVNRILVANFLSQRHLGEVITRIIDFQNQSPVSLGMIRRRFKTLLIWLAYFNSLLLGQIGVKKVEQGPWQDQLLTWICSEIFEPKDNPPLIGVRNFDEKQLDYNDNQRKIADCLQVPAVWGSKTVLNASNDLVEYYYKTFESQIWYRIGGSHQAYQAILNHALRGIKTRKRKSIK